MEHWETGRVQVYCGDGKGKTTAAIGLAVRAAGAGLRVWIGQFCKGRDTSEHAALAMLNGSVTIALLGTPRFFSAPSDEDRIMANEGFLLACRALCSGDFNLVVLDEMLWAVEFGLVNEEELLRAIDARDSGVEVVLTGRHASDALIAKADLVTEMREVKHYYAAGVPARRGIEL